MGDERPSEGLLVITGCEKKIKVAARQGLVY